MVSLAVITNAFPGLLFASVTGGCVYAYHTSRNNEIDRQQKLDVFVLVSAKTIDNQVTSTELYKTAGAEKNKNYKCKLLLEFDCEIVKEVTATESKKIITFPEDTSSLSSDENLVKTKLLTENSLFLIKTKYINISSFFKNNSTDLEIKSIDPNKDEESKIFGKFKFIAAKDTNNKYYGQFFNFLGKVKEVSDGINPSTDTYKCSFENKDKKELVCEIYKFTSESQEVTNTVVNATVSASTPQLPPVQASDPKIKQIYEKFTYIGTETKADSPLKQYDFQIIKFDEKNKFELNDFSSHKNIYIEKVQEPQPSEKKTIIFDHLKPVLVHNGKLIIF